MPLYRVDNDHIAADSFAIDHLAIDQVVEAAGGQEPFLAAFVTPLFLEMVRLSKVHAASKGNEDFQRPAAFGMAD